MPFQSPSFGPLVRRVVMIDVEEQEAGSGPVDDQPDVATDPNGPEVLVLRPVDLVQLQARMRRIHLEVERRGLHRLLLVAGQLREAVGEGVGDSELHPSRSVVIAARTLPRRLRRLIDRWNHPPGRISHVFETRFGLSPADASEDLADIVAALGGELVAYRTHLGDDKVIAHRHVTKIAEAGHAHLQHRDAAEAVELGRVRLRSRVRG